MTAVSSDLVGLRIEPTVYNVEPSSIAAFASATNDERPEYVDESRDGGIVAPPLFAVVPEFTVLNSIVSELGLPLDRILHGEQDMRFVSPIRPGDVLETEAELVEIADRSTGQTVTMEATTRTLENELRVRSLMTIFVRQSANDGKRKPRVQGPERSSPVAREEMAVRQDQPAIYADASGDHNAPHVDESFARAIGFRTVILQGLCTMAFTSKAVIDSVCQGHSAKLRRLRVRFSDVVYPGDVLTTSIWRDEDEQYSFETASQSGTVVIRDGLAEIRHE